jgi:hypothetical protein
MRIIFNKLMIVTMIFLGSSCLYADEHWLVTNMKGYVATADNYKYEKTAMAVDEFVVVFTEKGGSVSNSDLNFIKLNDSTLIGIGEGTREDTKGYSALNIYQINRKTKKMHYIETRINTHVLTLSPVMALAIKDKCGSMVGDAKRLGYLPTD